VSIPDLIRNLAVKTKIPDPETGLSRRVGIRDSGLTQSEDFENTNKETLMSKAQSNVNLNAEIKKLEKKFGKISGVCKILLSTDGSITGILNALSGEVTAKILVQKTQKADTKTAKLLNIKEGEEFNFREVLICGCNRPLIKAVSFSVLKRFSADFRKDLLSTDIPIGNLLKKHNVESRREITALSANVKDNLLLREYRIISNGEILMHIKEQFSPKEF